MKKTTKDINQGGVNGTGKGVVNTNSQDFKGLRVAIQGHAKKQNPLDRIRYELISIRFQMEGYVSDESSTIKKAGDFLKSHLKAINITNKEFAKYVEMEESNLSAIIKGRRKINIDLAFKLGQVFKLNPNLWLLIQSKNELLGVDKKKRLAYQKYKLEDLLKKTR